MRSTVVILFLLILVFTQPCFAQQKNCDHVPPLNQKITAFVKSKVNKKVSAGECWDLAAQALDQAQAIWDHNYQFGRIINPKSECIYPGDIIQFEGVELEYKKDNRIYREDLFHHTAIIMEVKDKENFVLAQQNTSMHGKKVSLDDFDVKSLKKGSFKIYRPVK